MTCLTKLRQFLLWVASLGPTGLLLGCAVGPYGALHSEVHLTDCAVVVQTRSYGAHLRTARHDAGLSVGFAERLSVYRRDDAAGLKGGSYAGYSPPVRSRPVAYESTTHGLGVRLSPPRLGLTLGYERYALLAYVAENENLAYQVEMVPADPARTTLRYHQEDKECGMKAS